VEEVAVRSSLSSLQSVVGLVAGLTSIGGALYSSVRLLYPSDSGRVAVVVHEARTDAPLRDAAIEVLTPEDALVTTMALADDGSVQQALKEGVYRLRVDHPGFEAQVRSIQVVSGETAQVRFALAPRSDATSGRRAARRPSPVAGAARAVKEGVGSATRFFRDLGL
jgi:hypothetical protein